MQKILVNFAHPSRSRSKINNALRSAIEGLENVTINDLYATYPDFLIDIEREQRLCEAHDIIIFQHPFYWYSTPSIMKEWLDLVLKHGWAYGSQGNALKGKYFLQAITAGGDDGTYQKGGRNLFPIEDLVSPYRATANLCKMNWLPPFMVMGIHRGLPSEKVKVYAEDYRYALIALRDGTMDLDLLKTQKYLNSNLKVCIKRP